MHGCLIVAAWARNLFVMCFLYYTIFMTICFVTVTVIIILGRFNILVSLAGVFSYLVKWQLPFWDHIGISPGK